LLYQSYQPVNISGQPLASDFALNRLVTFVMKAEHNNQQRDQRDNSYQPRRDRLDWISKYLELADKVIQNHPPELAEDSGES
jgi:hypothetical protein